MSDSLTSCSRRRSIVSAEAAWRRGGPLSMDREALEEILAYESDGREALLAAIILGPNPEGRVYAAEGLPPPSETGCHAFRRDHAGNTLLHHGHHGHGDHSACSVPEALVTTRPRSFGGVAQLARARVS